jgi:6-phosphofructokinase 1
MKPRIGVLTSGGDCHGKETHCCVLGHLQRGGAPTTLDRILATRFGVKAVQLANEGHFGSMVSYQNYQVRHVPILKQSIA